MAKIKARFKGIADTRIISAKDLETKHGIKVDQDLVWHRGNAWAVELDADDKMEKLLRAEGHFTITKLNDDGTEAIEAKAEDPAKEGDVLKDGDTGATTPAKAKPKS